MPSENPKAKHQRTCGWSWQMMARHQLRLWQCDSGAVLIYVTLLASVLIGFSALVFDGGRVYIAHQQLQDGVDALALAGAAELDGRSGARQRATEAITSALSNRETFGSGGASVAAAETVFLESLPTDNVPLLTIDQALAYEAASDQDAAFVWVRAVPQTVASMFITAIGGARGTSVGATAVAGFTLGFCNFTPVFICSPWPAQDFATQFYDPNNRRREYAFKGPDPGSSQFEFSSGNFGWLSTLEGDKGAANLGAQIARQFPEACVFKRGVTLRPGNVASLAQYLNVRFDIYMGPLTSQKATYPPATNVTKGFIGTNCNKSAWTASDGLDPNGLPKAVPLPHDDDFPNYANLNGQQGSGVYDLCLYFQKNHPDLVSAWASAGGFSATDCSSINAEISSLFGESPVPRRYNVYRWENGDLDGVTPAGSLPDNCPGDPTGGCNDGEMGAPTCNPSNLPTPGIDRRLIYAAVLDCTNQTVGGGVSGPYLVDSFISIFLTRPMEQGGLSGDTIYGEMVDILGVNGSGDADLKKSILLYK